MTAMAENPLERFDLKVGATLAELTASLRERIEDAETEDEQNELRALWESLTGTLATRATLVLGAMPALAHELPPLSRPPKLEVPAPRAFERSALPELPLEWASLAAPPDPDDRILAALDEVEIP